MTGNKGCADLFSVSLKHSEKRVMKKLRLKISVSTNIGHIRTNNEDNFYADGKKLTDGISDDFSTVYEEEITDTAVFAVCDGMGGESCGEVASAAAVKVLGKYRDLINGAENLKEQGSTVDAYAKAASRYINEKVAEAGGERGGTTLTLACIRERIITMYYLGDSRIYLLRDGVLTRLTRDHTVAYDMIDSSVLTEEEAEVSPDRHKLTMYLGIDEDTDGVRAGFAGSYTLTEGDRYLMCTDGLNEMCSTEEIKSVLAAADRNTARSLVESALENGGRDNVTCLVIEVVSK